MTTTLPRSSAPRKKPKKTPSHWTKPTSPTMVDDLPLHARERLQDMRAKRLFTSDLSVSEFLLVKEAGFDPLGLVMGSSIYQITPNIPQLAHHVPGCELESM